MAGLLDKPVPGARVIRHDLRRLEGRLAELPKVRLLASIRAQNRALTTTRAASARALAREYPGVRIGDLKRRLRFKRATKADPIGWLEFSGRRVAVYGNFGMRPVGRWGVRFSKMPWRLEGVSGDPVTPEILARAFRNPGRGGRQTVFARWTRQRLSHEVLVAPGPARAFSERGIGEAMTLVARRRYAEVFRQEANFRLSR